MKYCSVIKLLCRHCRFTKYGKFRYVRCPANPRHKQRQGFPRKVPNNSFSTLSESQIAHVKNPIISLLHDKVYNHATKVIKNAIFWFSSESVDSHVYTTIDSAKPCILWLNTTGEAGCSSFLGSVFGRLWPIVNISEFEFLQKNRQHDDLVLVLESSLFNRENLKIIYNLEEIVGLIIVDLRKHNISYANKHLDCSAHNTSNCYSWNPDGLGLIEQKIELPLWYISDNTSTNLILKKAVDNSLYNEKWGARLNSNMFAYKDAITCLNFDYCQPIGGYSVYAALGKDYPAFVNVSVTKNTNNLLLANPEKHKKLIVSVCAMDSRSLFPQVAIGAEGTLSGLISNLVASRILSDQVRNERIPPPHKWKKNVLMAFFEAESWGYLGSNRFVNDWSKFECFEMGDGYCKYPYLRNIKLDFKIDQIDALFEWKQVGLKAENNDDHLYAYMSNDSVYKEKLLSIENISLANNNLYNWTLPPSSVHSFLNYSNYSKSLLSKTFVVSDHDGPYINKNYESRFDTELDIDKLALSATLLAKTIYLMANEDNLNIELDSSRVLVEMLSNCFTKNLNCQSDSESDNSTSFFNELSHYHQVFVNNKYSPMTIFVQNYLNSNWEKLIDYSACEEHCKTSKDVGKCMNEECFRYINVHPSYSLGLKRRNSKWVVEDEKYPNWVESDWSVNSLELIWLGSYEFHVIFLILSICASLSFCIFFVSLAKILQKSKIFKF